MQVLARSIKKPCMLIHMYNSDLSAPSVEEIFKAAPYLNMDDYQIIADEHGIIIFDSAEEMEHAYQQTVGDDGPTALNQYNGKCRVSALTCYADGSLGGENT